MTATKPRDRSLQIFAIIAFGVPWIGWTILNAAAIDWGTTLGQALFFTGLACSFGGIAAMAAWRGAEGCRDLLRSALKWRVPLRWWLFVLLVPLVAIWASGIAYLALTRAALELPDLGAMGNWLSLAALMIFLPGPLGEEFGWRGFLQPRLMERFSFVAATLVTGAVWAVWHLPLYWGRVEDGGALWFALFSVGVIGFSFLIAIVWEATGSLLLAMMMHFAINLSQNWTFFPQVGGDEAIAFLVAYVAVLWTAAIAALVMRQRRVRSAERGADPAIPAGRAPAAAR